MAYCSKCGSELEENARFCTVCGAKTKAPAPAGTNVSHSQPAPSLAQTPPDTSSASKPMYFRFEKAVKFLYIGAALLLVIFIVWSATGKTCSFCGEKFHGTGYYDIADGESILCADCAKEYYAPFPYQNYRA